MFKELKEKFFGRGASKWAAKNRLQMVLVQDRSGLTTQDMEGFQKELLAVISKYFVLESNALNVEWQRSENTTALIINTPIIGRPQPEVKVANS